MNYMEIETYQWQANKAQFTHLSCTGNIHALVCSCIEVDDLE